MCLRYKRKQVCWRYCARVVEIADMLVVNKADGDLERAATRTVADYKNALHLMSPRSITWSPLVMSCSAKAGTNIQQVWENMCEFKKLMTASGELQAPRRAQKTPWALDTYNGIGIVGIPVRRNRLSIKDVMPGDPVREWILDQGGASAIKRISAVGGGCISTANRYDTDAGSFYVKTNRQSTENLCSAPGCEFLAT